MPRHKTKTDEEVLSAVGRVLLEKGPHHLTLSDVAAEAGISPATLLQRYGTKRAMILAWVRADADAAQSDLLRPMSNNPLFDLVTMLRARAAFAQNRRHLANSMMLLLEDVRDPEFRELAAVHQRHTVSMIQRFLEAAQALGQISAEPASFAQALWDAWSGALISWGILGSAEPVEDFVVGRLERLIHLAATAPR